MHDWRSGLEFPFEPPDPPAPLDNDMLVVDNLRLHAEVAEIERKLQQATTALQNLSGRLVELERQVQHAAGLEAAIAAMQAEVVATHDALQSAEARAVELDRAQAELDAARRRAESQLEALQQTRVLRYSKGPRSLYTRLRHLAERP